MTLRDDMRAQYEAEFRQLPQVKQQMKRFRSRQKDRRMQRKELVKAVEYAARAKKRLLNKLTRQPGNAAFKRLLLDAREKHRLAVMALADFDDPPEVIKPGHSDIEDDTGLFETPDLPFRDGQFATNVRLNHIIELLQYIAKKKS